MPAGSTTGTTRAPTRAASVQLGPKIRRHEIASHYAAFDGRRRGHPLLAILLLSIADAYMLLAHVQAVVDDKTAVYAEPKLE